MPEKHRIDLNADLGEGVGDDAALMTLVTSANIACGGHAGGGAMLRAALVLALDHGVAAGAHPGYADRANFGRLAVPMTDAALLLLVTEQVAAACEMAAEVGHRMCYVKPHGALYNLAATDAGVSAVVCDALRAVDPALALLCLSGSVTERLARDRGMPVFAEIFADRAYLPNGSLVPRGQPGAVIHAPDQVVARVLDMLRSGCARAVDGTALPLVMESLCLHGDTPGAVALARLLRAAMLAEGITIAPFTSP